MVNDGPDFEAVLDHFGQNRKPDWFQKNGMSFV